MEKDRRVGATSAAAPREGAGAATPGKATRVPEMSMPGLFEGAAPQWSAIDPDEAMHGLAAQGVAGGGAPLPYLDQIQRSFGRYDVTGVRAHVGGDAADAAAQMGAAGYATGNNIALRDASSLHTVAHEAAHVVQQRSGVHLKGGVGSANDEYERNADAVADRVVRGESAEELLAPYAGGGGGGGSTQAVQRYQVVTDPKLPWSRISNDGRMAVEDHEEEAWATPDLIVQANKILDANKSRATIEAVGSLKKVKTGNREHYMKQFKMVDRKAGFYDRHFGDSEIDLVDDCGGAAQQNLGGERLNDRRFQAVTTAYGTVDEFTAPSAYRPDDNRAGGNLSTTEQMSGEIYVRIMQNEFKKTLSRIDALAEWDKLGDAQKDALSKKYGINRYAVPKMGQGITKGSERDMPGASGAGYNFHFSLNLMTSGEDYLALEDFDSSGRKYYFKMYGPASQGQSFTEDADNDTTDKQSTSMVVVHPHMLDGKMKVEAPLRDAYGKELAKLAKGTVVKIVLKGNTDFKVEVITGEHRSKVGWIYANQYIND